MRLQEDSRINERGVKVQVCTRDTVQDASNTVSKQHQAMFSLSYYIIFHFSGCAGTKLLPPRSQNSKRSH